MSNLDRHLRLAEVFSNDITKAISLDLDIALDHSRYANWLLGFSTAGLALTVYKINELIPASLLAKLELENTGYFATIVFLVVSIFTGVWAKRNVLEAANLKRQQVAAALAQKSILLAKDTLEDDLNTMRNKMGQMAYLPIEDKLRVESLERQDTDLASELKLIHSQEVLLGCSYSLILLSSVPI